MLYSEYMKAKSINGIKKPLLICLVIVLLCWPILVDENALGLWLCPNLCNGHGVPIPFILKAASILVGSITIAATSTPSKFKNWQRWTWRIAWTTLIFVLFLVVSYVYDLARDLTF
jgi:hypothetical protein